MPSSKLREATSGKKGAQTISERERLEPAEIVSGPRGSRAKKSYIVESESESEEEQDEEDEDEDAEGDEDEDLEEEEEEEEEEEVVPIEEQIGEPERSDDDVSPDEGNDVDEEEEELEEAADESADADADGDDDVDMEDESPMPAPTPAPKKVSSAVLSKPSVTVTPAQTAPLKSVEAKEMSMADEDEDDEELSSIESDGEDMEQDDAEDGDAQSLGMGSRGSTPDVSKMTKRQRSRLDQVMGSDDFLQLPMGASWSYLTLFLFLFQFPLSPFHSQLLELLSAPRLQHIARPKQLTPTHQNPNRKRSSPQKNTPCAAQKWPAAGRT